MLQVKQNMMLQFKQIIFNNITSFLGFEEYFLLQKVCKFFKKKINEINEYKKYKIFLKNIAIKHLNYESLLTSPNEVFLENDYFPYIFYDLLYLKETVSINVIHNGNPDIYTFTRLKSILNINSSKSNLKHIRIVINSDQFINNLDNFFINQKQISGLLTDNTSQLESIEFITTTNFCEICLQFILNVISHTSIKKLQIRNYHVKLENFYKIEQALIENKTIESLTIKNLFIYEGTSENCLNSVISKNFHIKNLKLENCLNKTGKRNSFFSLIALTSKTTNLDVVLESLYLNKSIEKLTLSKVDKTSISESAVGFEKLFRINKTIKKIKMKYCALTSGDMNIFSSGLSVNSSLVELNLSHNNITSEGLAILLDSMDKRRNLGIKIQKLNISDNLLDNKCNSIFSEFLKNGDESLKYLDISENVYYTNLFVNWETLNRLETLKCRIKTISTFNFGNFINLLSKENSHNYLENVELFFNFRADDANYSILTERFYELVLKGGLRNLIKLYMNFLLNQNILESLRLLNLNKNLTHLILDDSIVEITPNVSLTQNDSDLYDCLIGKNLKYFSIRYCIINGDFIRQIINKFISVSDTQLDYFRFDGCTSDFTFKKIEFTNLIKYFLNNSMCELGIMGCKTNGIVSDDQSPISNLFYHTFKFLIDEYCNHEMKIGFINYTNNYIRKRKVIITDNAFLLNQLDIRDSFNLMIK